MDQPRDTSADAALVAFAARSQLTALGPDGWKLDFIIRRVHA